MKNLENLKLQELTIGEQVNTSGGCIIKIFFGFCPRFRCNNKDKGIDKTTGPKIFGR